jgi:hypothetical protein
MGWRDNIIQATGGTARLVDAHPALTTTLRNKLAQRRQELASQVAEGNVMSWEDYRHRIGKIKAFDEAIELCIESERELNGG